MIFSPRTLSVLAVVCAALMFFSGCASSGDKKKKKKRKRTVLTTKYEEADAGAEGSRAVAAQMGVLDDAALNAYITRIGRKLLRGLPRRNFAYHFSVVDQVEPNAFALPGGYVFISRGLLAMANNEDELACVIGHEITHVAHRHAAAQQGMQGRMNPLSMGYIKASKMAEYGREMERDADQGGQVLCASAGYDPMGMSTFLASLGQSERMHLGYTRGPSFFDTHPGSRERAAANAIRAKEIRRRYDPTLGDTKVSLFKQINGLPIGQRPETGIFVGDRFLHPDMDFAVRFPAGWRVQNSNQAVGATAPRGDAMVYLTADMPAGDPQTMAETWVAKARKQARVGVEESKHVKIGHIDSWRMKLSGGSRAGTLISYVTFIPYRNLTWSLTGITLASKEKVYLGRTLLTARSFGPLDARDRSKIFGTNLDITTAMSGDGFKSLGKRTGNSWSEGNTAMMNGLFVDHRFRGGELVKIVRRERYAGKKPEKKAKQKKPARDGAKSVEVSQ
jgi:predicted Zn-dependent protease